MQEIVDLVTFTEEILNRKFHFLWMIKCSCNVTVHAIQADLLHIANRKTKVKKKEKKYINFSNH